MKKLLTCLFVAVIFVGCAKAEESFKGNSYSTKHNDTEITLDFHPTENKVFGRVVNNYFGSYTLDGKNIKFGPLASTMMMGPEDAMQTEQEYLAFIDSVVSYEIKGDSLILKNSDGKEMTFQKTGAVNP